MDHLQPGTLFKEGERKHTHTNIHKRMGDIINRGGRVSE